MPRGSVVPPAVAAQPAVAVPVEYGPLPHRAPTVAFCLTDGAGVTLREQAPDLDFYAASTMKLAVLLALAAGCEAGEIRWETPLRVPSAFRSVTGDGPFRFDDDHRDDPPLPAGDRLTGRELADAMIVRSSNTATNVLLARLTIPAVVRTVDEFGIAGCRVQRPIGDAAAAARGLTNTVTPRALCALMRALVFSPRLSADTHDVVWRMLQRQADPVIATQLGPGIPHGSKSGSVPGIEHDVALVGDPASGPDAVQILAVCTQGFDPEPGRARIRAVARRLRA